MASLVAWVDGGSKAAWEDGGLNTTTAEFRSFASHLLDAATSGNVSVFQSLPTEKIFTALSLRDYGGRSLLHTAALKGHIEVVKLLAKHSDIFLNRQDNRGLAPIHSCICKGSLDMVEELISLGANVDIKTFLGLTPLHYAALYGMVKEAQLLIKHGADVNAKDRALSTPLHKAAGRGKSLELCKFLLEKGAELDAVDQAGQTPLTHAVICDCKEVVQYLIRRGADTEIKTEYMVLRRYPADYLNDSKTKRKKTSVEFHSKAVRLSGCNLNVNVICGMNCGIDRMTDETTLESANVALSWYNGKLLSEKVKGREYELVKVVGGIMLLSQSLCHCNFIARPKNGSEAQNSLFFAEVKLASGNHICTICSIIRGTHTKTGLSGCKICDRFPGLIQHPDDVRMDSHNGPK